MLTDAGYSPALGIITASLEVLGALWILTRNHHKTFYKTTAALLLLLAGYQFFEVLICTGKPESRLWLSRLAFLDVTWLPPLCLVLLAQIEKSVPWWIKIYSKISLILAGIFSLWIIMDTRFITGTICEFMYARYWYIEPYYHLYGAFYEITQLSSIFIMIYRMVHCTHTQTRHHLADLLSGILLFIIPALLLGTTLPQKFEMAMPSVMCHFAIFLALLLIRIVWREEKELRT